MTGLVKFAMRAAAAVTALRVEQTGMVGDWVEDRFIYIYIDR